jgi:hypothetical protein
MLLMKKCFKQFWDFRVLGFDFFLRDVKKIGFEMPPKKVKNTKRVSDDPKETTAQLDVQYNSDLVPGLLQDLNDQVSSRCNQLQKDNDLMLLHMRQIFQLELLKIPTEIKKMPLSKFREIYGDNLDFIPVSTSATPAVSTSSTTMGPPKPPRQPLTLQPPSAPTASKVFQTPAFSRMNVGSGTVLRAPREGEKIISQNGSPLGEFSTVIKAPKV